MHPQTTPVSAEDAAVAMATVMTLSLAGFTPPALEEVARHIGLTNQQVAAFERIARMMP